MTTTAANALTAAWARTITGGTVLSGAGVYPLLHLLATAADGPARDELLAVAATPLTLPSGDAVRAATGLWPRADVPLSPAWEALVAGVLTGDRAPLDAWAAEWTGGLVPRMPVTVDSSTRLVLASALTVVTTWDLPFNDGWLLPSPGPWAGRRLAELSRFDPDLGTVRVVASPAGPLTTVTVHGGDDLDVVLLLGGPSSAPGSVVAAGITTLDGPSLPLDGPGIRHHRWPGAPGVYLRLPRFTVGGDHDLLDHADLFGLATATDAGRGHFPGIGPEPLAVQRAAQAATATFTAVGFKAAAITVVATMAGGAMLGDQHDQVEVAFDRPFGFLTVHRPTGLVLFAGWVDDPEPSPFSDDAVLV
ncbi:serpin family protein [Dactylosporangium cerinum]|uniref:Serpin family protein n=1 Tax=Dactylosporangium cerinum TaxID=1434730 RepID=A0ABV9VXW2_9ACTN